MISMDIKQVKYNLNETVGLYLPRHYVDAEYTLTGCILRRKGTTNDFFYQAEVMDKNNNSVCIVSLEDIHVIRRY